MRFVSFFGFLGILGYFSVFEVNGPYTSRADWLHIYIYIHIFFVLFSLFIYFCWGGGGDLRSWSSVFKFEGFGESVDQVVSLKGPCTYIVHIGAFTGFLYSSFGAQIYTTWVRGPLGPVDSMSRGRFRRLPDVDVPWGGTEP